MNHRALNVISSVVRNTVDRDSHASMDGLGGLGGLGSLSAFLKASRGEDAPSASALTPTMR